VAEADLRAHVRIGELTKALAKAQGVRTDKQLSPAAGESSKGSALKGAKLTWQDASRCERLAAHAGDVERYIATVPGDTRHLRGLLPRTVGMEPRTCPSPDRGRESGLAVTHG
jgi:hypothetical protein